MILYHPLPLKQTDTTRDFTISIALISLMICVFLALGALGALGALELSHLQPQMN